MQIQIIHTSLLYLFWRDKWKHQHFLLYYIPPPPPHILLGRQAPQSEMNESTQKTKEKSELYRQIMKINPVNDFLLWDLLAF